MVRKATEPCCELLLPPAFSVSFDRKCPSRPGPSAYLSLPWTGLLVWRGVEGPDNSEEALHCTLRGDRGRVLCPLGQAAGSGDSAGKERGGTMSQKSPFCRA